MGGVVNIILKKKGSNTIGVGFGNRGQQNYNASVGNEKFTIGYNLEKFGKVNGISESDIDYNDFEGSTRTDADNVEKTMFHLATISQIILISPIIILKQK